METNPTLKVSWRFDGKWGVYLSIDPDVSPSVRNQILSQFKAALPACRSVSDLEAAVRSIDAGLDGIDFEIDQLPSHADPLAHYVTIRVRPSRKGE